jgi:hypothetical protein
MSLERPISTACLPQYLPQRIAHLTEHQWTYENLIVILYYHFV